MLNTSFTANGMIPGDFCSPCNNNPNVPWNEVQQWRVVNSSCTKFEACESWNWVSLACYQLIITKGWWAIYVLNNKGMPCAEQAGTEDHC